MAVTQADRQTRALPTSPRQKIKHPMDKRQLIEEIRQFNATATLPFLQQFDEKDLQEYLSHLQAAARNETRIGGWVRKKPRFRMAS
jgi:hypothetical protein